MASLAFDSQLNADEWVFRVGELRASADWPQGSAADSSQYFIEIDLSRVRYADFLALGRILILTYALTLAGVKVTVRLPDDDLLDDERAFLDEKQDELVHRTRERVIARRRRQRLNCQLYMRQAGFEASLQSGPFADMILLSPKGNSGNQIISRESDIGPIHPPDTRPVMPPRSVTPPEEEQQEAFQEPRRQRRILPYRWLDVSGLGSSTSLQETAAFERALRLLRLPSYDATALATGIIAELIENVREHAYPPQGLMYALIGGYLVQPENYGKRITDFDRHLQGLARWAFQSQSPLLRLFVGDAGQGMHASLKNSPGLDFPLPQRPLEEAGPTAGSAILQALEHHAASGTERSGPRGLWRVMRVTRSFQGSVLATTGSAVAGYVFDASTDSRVITESSPYWLPGTMIECNLLMGARRDTDSNEEELPSPIPALGSGASLACLTANLLPTAGLEPDDLEIVRQRLQDISSSAETGLAVALEIPPGIGSPTDWEIQRALRGILEIASAEEYRASVAVVFPDISRKLLSLAISDLNLQQDNKAEGLLHLPSSPILVVAPDNRHYWVGGTAMIRSVLARLSQGREPRRIAEFLSSLDHDQGSQLVQEIARNPRLIGLESGAVALKLRPQDAIEALTKHFGRQIESAIELGTTRGVEKGIFLTPSLRLTSRWTDVRRLLQQLRCHRMAGFLLAAAVASRSTSMPLDPARLVVRVGSVDEQLASIFALSLNNLETTFDDVVSLPKPDLSIREASPHPVVLCADLISTGASVRRAIRGVRELGFNDITIATVVDARDLEHSGESPDYILVNGIQTPVVSLACVSISVVGDREDDEPIFIDPVIGEPLPRKYPHARTIMNQEEYKKAIVRSGAARLGHIRRGRRHYAAYMYPTILFTDDIWAKFAMRRIMSIIISDNATVREKIHRDSAHVCIIYPTGISDDSLQIAINMTSAIRASGLPCSEPIGVPRAASGRDWVFPRAIRLDTRVSHVVAIDSSSKTGATLRQLIRLAAQPDVELITCFALVNGMTDLESMTLQQARSVRRYSSDDRPTSDDDITVNVKYLVRTATTNMDSTVCSVCGLRESYSSLPSSLPDSLDQQRAWLTRVLRPRTRETVFADEATDLFGMPIEQEDCVAYLVWRSFLEEANFGTESRRYVVRRITDLVDAVEDLSSKPNLIRDRDAFIRLIAAEPHRLDLAPLWFTSVREKLIKLALSPVQGPESLANDPVLRVQALMVLARADVRRFASEYASLVKDCSDHEVVLRQVLIEAVRLAHGLSRSTDWLKELAQQVSLLLHEIHIDRSDADWNPAWIPVEECHYLSSLLERYV